MKEKSTNMEGNIEIAGNDQEISTIGEPTQFTTHNMCFKFAIVTGEQPKSINSFNMNHWTGYRFIENDHMITSTTNSIIMNIKKDLGAGTIDELNLKYNDIAKVYARNFSEKHELVLGEINQAAKPHYTIPTTSIEKILSKREGTKT